MRGLFSHGPDLDREMRGNINVRLGETLASACCEMSRRDGAIVAWHEVPGTGAPESTHQQKNESPFRTGTLDPPRPVPRPFAQCLFLAPSHPECFPGPIDAIVSARPTSGPSTRQQSLQCAGRSSASWLWFSCPRPATE